MNESRSGMSLPPVQRRGSINNRRRASLVANSLERMSAYGAEDLPAILSQATNPNVRGATLSRVSIMQASNKHIMEGLDDILSMLKTEDKELTDDAPLIDAQSTPGVSKDTADTFNDALADKERELMRIYELKFQEALRVVQENAACSIKKAAEENEERVDILRRESLEREDLMKMKLTSESKSRIKNITKILVQNISHEIRNPLNVVSTGLHLINEMIHSGDDSSTINISEITDVIMELKKSCQACNDVLDDIVLYESLKLGELKLTTESFHVYKAIKLLLQEFVLHCRLLSVTLVYEESVVAGTEVDEGPLLQADKERVLASLHTLITSALRHSQRGGKLTVRALRTHSFGRPCLRLEVIDTGAGLSETDRLKIFDDSLEAHIDGLNISTQGAGLRMWICKEVVEQHGGRVGALSDGLHQGATFFMELPLEESYSSGGDEDLLTMRTVNVDAFKDLVMKTFRSQSGKTLGRGESPVRKLKVLLVEDLPSCRKMHRRLVEDHCRILDEASDGVECVEMVSRALEMSEPYDLILLDNNMPNMTGVEAAATIRRLGCRSRIIGVTGNARPEDVAEFLSSGADKVLLKPLQIESINDIVLEAVAHSRSMSVLTKFASFKELSSENNSNSGSGTSMPQPFSFKKASS